MRGIAAIGPSASAGLGYPEFQAHIATQATEGPLAWNTVLGTGNMGARRVTAAAATGSMVGTPWAPGGTGALYGSVLARVIRHSLPSLVVFNDQIANGREVLIRMAGSSGTIEAFALSRNGYTSAGAYDDVDGLGYFAVTELIYWDGTQAQRMLPSAQSGPTPYSWA